MQPEENTSTAEVAKTEAKDETISTLVKYVPDTVDNKEGYVKLVSDQILGRDRQGKARPMLDLVYFLQVCQASNLNPVKKEIYGVYYFNSQIGKDELSIMTGIDGFRAAAERTGLYAGSDDAVVEYDDNKKPVKATVTVYKLNRITGERMPTSATAHFSEFYPSNPKKRKFWNSMPVVMISKCAEAQALRKAFPNTGQIYVPEEMDQRDNVVINKMSKNERLALAEEAKQITESRKEEAETDENNA